MIKMDDKLAFLKEVYLFKDIPDSQITPLLNVMHFRNYARGEDVIREGEEGSSLFFLFKGKVSVTKKLTLFADYLEKSRMDKSLVRLQDSDFAFFGEMSLCGEAEKRSATVTAESDCELGELAADEIFKLVKDNQDFASKFYRNLSKVLADRLRKANRDILKVTTALSLALEE
jgi:CRP-like cAMP-binding protein